MTESKKKFKDCHGPDNTCSGNLNLNKYLVWWKELCSKINLGSSDVWIHYWHDLQKEPECLFIQKAKRSRLLDGLSRHYMNGKTVIVSTRDRMNAVEYQDLLEQNILHYLYVSEVYYSPCNGLAVSLVWFKHHGERLEFISSINVHQWIIIFKLIHCS